MNSINIFSKCPYSSKCKTRLRNLLNKDERSFLSKYMLINILDEVTNTNHSIINLWIYPHFNHVFFTEIKKKYKVNLYRQEGSNLSERLNHCLYNQSSIHQKVIILGSDIPTLNHRIIADAVKSLNYKKYVIGPSKDGGFYLLGSTIHRNNIFNTSGCAFSISSKRITL